ncbi:MAG TPA: T9SS type A sorting domain-containing protein, partial [Rhodothermales bacterium]|nr:T9SS type A sorting domain-containing protein [Rhodothermales bacterium]
VVVVRGTSLGPAYNVLDGFTITGGNATGAVELSSAGGLSASFATVIVRRCRIEGNTGLYTGGAAFSDVRAIVEDVAFVENTASYNGGAYVRNAEADFRRVSFTRNRGTNGTGGLATDRSLTRFEDVAFTENTGGGHGGGLSVLAGTVTLQRAAFIRNRAGRAGGGLRIDGSDATLVDVRFLGNLAGSNGSPYDDVGGAVAVAHGSLSLTNGVLVGNAASHGGAIQVFFPPGKLELRHVTAVANGTYETAPYGAGGTVIILDNTNVSVANSILAGNGIATRSDKGFALTGPVAPFVFRTSMAFPSRLTVMQTVLPDGCPNRSEATCTGLAMGQPRFVRAPSPGADGLWATADDDYGDLESLPGSSAVDLGHAALIPADRLDVDGDGDQTEPLPRDLAGRARVAGQAPDAGAFERDEFLSGTEEARQLGAQVGEPHPNPASDAVVIPLRMPAAEAVRVMVFDALGRQVAMVHEGVLMAGSHQMRLDASGLTPGLYVVRVLSSGGARTRRFLVTR